MKKIALFLSALAMLVACEKEEGGIQQNAKVTIGVNHEQVTDGVGRVAISENGNKFALNWEGIEELLVTTSTHDSYTSIGKGFEMTSHDGVSAKFTGELPNAGADVTVTNYFAAVSSFMSRSVANRNQIRLAIANNQNYNAANIANACMLVGELADCEVGVIPGDFSLKTMNAFIKIPVTKGAAANGSTNTYVNGMKLQSVKIEAVGGEQLSGRFAIDLAADDWSTAYATNTGISNSDKSSSITLNCDNLALTNEATNLYVAIAFGTYAQGLKVTFNVIGDNDKTGEMVRTIGGSGVTIARNTMLSMPPVAVTPTDVAVDLSDYSGSYLIVAKVSGVYYAMSTDADGSRRAAKALENFAAFTDIAYPTNDATIQWTVTKNGANYTISNGEKYLSWSEKTNNNENNDAILKDEPYLLKIVLNDDLETFKIASAAEPSRILAKNTNAQYGFAFYASSGVMDLYLKPFCADTRVALATPTVTAEAQDSSSIVASWNAVSGAANYTVTCGSSAPVVVEGTTHTFTNLAPSTEYTISVVANPANVSAHKPSAAGTNTATTKAAAAGTKYYTKVTTAPADWSGKYLVVCESQSSAANNNLTNKTWMTSPISISDNKIVYNAESQGYEVTLTKTTNGYTIQANNGQYINGVGDSATLTMDDAMATKKKGEWTIAIEDDKIVIRNANTTTRFLGWNNNTNTPGFKAYAISNIKTYLPATLYKAPTE